MVTRIINYIRWARAEFQGQKSTAHVYDQLATGGKYDNIVGYQKRVDGYKKTIANLGIPFSRVLDLACGTGAFIDALPEDNKIKITGIDISEGMLAVAKKRLNGDKRINFLKKDFMSLDFPESSFDLISMMNAIRFVPKGNESRFVKNIARLLSQNGTFLVVETDMVKIPYLSDYINTRFVKGSNMAMRIPKKLVEVMKPYFYLEKRRTVNHQAVVFTTRAYYFKKKSPIGNGRKKQCSDF